MTQLDRVLTVNCMSVLQFNVVQADELCVGIEV